MYRNLSTQIIRSRPFLVVSPAKICASAFSTNRTLLNKSIPSSNSTAETPSLAGSDGVISTNPQFPINVEVLYHKPLRHEVKYNDLVAEIHFRSYGIQNMDFFIDFAIRAAYYLGIPVTGPKPLPTKTEKWTVIKAGFVKAKSKENFQRKTHKRLLKAWDTNPEVLDLWFSVLNKYGIEGVGMKTNVFVKDDLEDALKQLKDVSFEIDDSNIFLKNDAQNTDLVAQRVKELLGDPIFSKHMKKDQKTVETSPAAEKNSEKATPVESTPEVKEIDK